MTGALTLPANPTANLHAAPKQYVDARAPVSDMFAARGISPLPSLWNMSLNNSMVSGTIGGMFFTCNTNRPCNRMAVLTTTAAAAGPTLFRMGIYKVDPTTNNMSGLVASTTNNPAALTGSLGWKVENITGGTEVVGGVWTPVVGRNYCAVMIHISAAAAPAVAACATMMAFIQAWPGDTMPMIYSLTGQTDLLAAPGNPAPGLNTALRGPNVVALFS